MKKILFNDKLSLTQAVLEGRKTQTRRIIKTSDAFERVNPDFDWDEEDIKNWNNSFALTVQNMSEEEKKNCFDYLLDHPKYKVGEVIAVAQSYKDLRYQPTDKTSIIRGSKIEFIEFQEHKGWTNKMFVDPNLMLHEIRITNVRVERLQDISENDCLKEGVVKDTCKTYFNGYAIKFSLDQYNNMMSSEWFRTPREAFAHLINKISGKGTWLSNPYVFVYDFELVK